MKSPEYGSEPRDKKNTEVAFWDAMNDSHQDTVPKDIIARYLAYIEAERLETEAKVTHKIHTLDESINSIQHIITAYTDEETLDEETAQSAQAEAEDVVNDIAGRHLPSSGCNLNYF